MNNYRHHVSGFFSQQVDAEYVLAELVALGFAREQLHLFCADSRSRTTMSHDVDNAVLANVLVDGAIGTVVGTGIGLFGELALVAANFSLFIASPLIAPLAMMGWGATLGGLIGAATGTESANGIKTEKPPTFSALVRDATAHGHVVLVVETVTPQETSSARQKMQESLGTFEDVSAR